MFMVYVPGWNHCWSDLRPHRLCVPDQDRLHRLWRLSSLLYYYLSYCIIMYIPCSFQHYSPPAEVVVITILVVLNVSTFCPCL